MHYLTRLHQIGSKKYRLRKPVLIEVEVGEDEAVVRWPESGAEGRGRHLEEAYQALRKHIISLYRQLKEVPDQDLSLWQLAQKKTLLESIQELGGSRVPSKHFKEKA